MFLLLYREAVKKIVLLKEFFLNRKIEENNKKVLPLETPSLSLQVPGRSLGTNYETKIFKFRWFLGTSNQNELCHAQSGLSD